MLEKHTVVYNILRNTDAFRVVSDEMFEELANVMQHESFVRGDIILKEGDKGEKIVIIVSGSISVRVEDTLIYKWTGMGGTFGEMSFITGQNYSASIVAESPDVITISISDEDLIRIGNDSIYKWLCLVLTEKLSKTTVLLRRFEEKNKKLEKIQNERRRTITKSESSNGSFDV